MVILNIVNKFWFGVVNFAKNIINLLGQDFIRIKFGIKNDSLKNNQMSAEKFVLKKTKAGVAAFILIMLNI